MELRPEQTQAANALLQSGDVLAVLPVRFGTSLIFQLFAAAAAIEINNNQGINIKQCWLFARCKVSLSITGSQKQEEWGCLPLRLPIFQMGSQGQPILTFCLVFGSAKKNMDIFQLTPQIKAF